MTTPTNHNSSPLSNDAEVVALRQQITQLGLQLADRAQVLSEVQAELALLQRIAANAPVMIYLFDLVDQRSTYSSTDLGLILGYSSQEILDMAASFLPSVMYPDDIAGFIEHSQRLNTLADGELREFEYRMLHKDGTWRWFSSRDIVFSRNEDNSVQCLLGVAQEITARKQFEAERVILQQQAIDMQNSVLRELSTPLIPINNHIAIMPLIGAIDSRRAEQMFETLLTGTSQTGVDNVIIDVTGVSIVDTQVAGLLIRAAQGIQLLGAQAILTGIRPEVAQTLVGLGIDLNQIVTRSTLYSGIQFAMSRR